MRSIVGCTRTVTLLLGLVAVSGVPGRASDEVRIPVGTKWTLVHSSIDHFTQDQLGIFQMSIEKGDQSGVDKFTIRSGCKEFSGAVWYPDRKVQFSVLSTRDAPCMSGELNRLDRALLELAKGCPFSGNSGVLFIKTGSDFELGFMSGFFGSID